MAIKSTNCIDMFSNGFGDNAKREMMENILKIRTPLSPREVEQIETPLILMEPVNLNALDPLEFQKRLQAYDDVNKQLIEAMHNMHDELEAAKEFMGRIVSKLANDFEDHSAKFEIIEDILDMTLDDNDA